MRSEKRLLAGLMLLVLLLTGCGTSPIAGPEAPASTPARTEAEVPETEACDVDLTRCSATVVYATVFQMMNQPEDYEGKRIRMQGVCATQVFPDKTVYGCIIADATACCKQGMEFVLSDAYSSEDYPAPGDDIVVSGTFQLYQQGEFTFCHMVDCRLEND